MAAFWAELKRRLKVGWALVAALGGSLLVLAIWLLSKKKTDTSAATDFDRIDARTKERIAAANARAAIEVTVARGKETAVREQLAEIDRDPDGPRRRQRMIELAAQVEGRRQ